MIRRIWHGYTTPENAGAYQKTLFDIVIPGIRAMGVAGFRGIEVLRRDRDDEVEFVTLMSFDDMDAVRGFVGDDPEVAHVPAEARAVLTRFDPRVVHYEVVGGS